MKLITKIVGACLGVALIGSVGIVALNNSVKLTHASAHNITLNIDNSPDLSNGEGTQDINGVKWEYYNASDNETGHVSLGHQGYAGVASTTDWGYTGIDSITANFTSNDNELWLLSSYDGIEWHEQCMLESGEPTTLANDWRYVRFYNWSDSNTNIDIASINIGYSCSGETSSEDIDSAHLGNLKSYSSSLTPYEETSDVSPLGNSTRALRFEKDPTDTAKTNIIVSLYRTYTFAEIANQNIEFDLKVANEYGKIVELMSGNEKIGLSLDSKQCTSYEITDLGNNWYHIELPINAIDSLISGYDGKNVSKNANKTIDAIRFNFGACIIDNLRIGGTQCAAGVYNSKTYKPVVGEIWWFKVSWTGALHSVNITLDDNTIGRRVSTTDPKLAHSSPFYIEWLSSGTVTLTAEVVCGYNRTTQTVQKTITIN